MRYGSACFALQFAILVGLSAFSCGIKSLSTHLLQCFSAVQGLITKHFLQEKHLFSTSLPLHTGECNYSIFQVLAWSQLQPSFLGLSLMFMGMARVQKVLLHKLFERLFSVARLICHSSNWCFMSLFVLDLRVIYAHIWPTQPISHVYGQVGKIKQNKREHKICKCVCEDNWQLSRKH